MEIFNFSQFFGYAGIAMFAFEGNGIVINLKASAKDKVKYSKLLRAAILTVITWFLIMATVSYATYKDNTQ